LRPQTRRLKKPLPQSRAVNALAVGLLDKCVGVEFAKVVTESHSDELVHSPNEDGDDEPSEPCPAADGENIPVREIEDKKRHDVKK